MSFFLVCNEDSTTFVLNDQNAMETSGWSINFDTTLNQIGQCGDGGSWTSYTGHAVVGSMSYIFSGEGTFKLQFSNCWNAGYVPVLYDGAEIGRSTTQDDVQTIEQAYEDGKVLVLKDEGINSVVRVLEFTTTTSCATGKKRSLEFRLFFNNFWAFFNFKRIHVFWRIFQPNASPYHAV